MTATPNQAPQRAAPLCHARHPPSLGLRSLGPSRVRNLFLIFILAASACTRKPDSVETLPLPGGFTLSMERFIPSRPLIELVPSPDPSMPTESVFIHHP